MTGELPNFVREMLDDQPRAGEGVHAWLFRVARQLHAHLPALEIVRLLESAVSNCGRTVPRSEIEDAVRNSMACAWQPRGRPPEYKPACPKWPPPNLDHIEAVCNTGLGLADLWGNSEPRIEDGESHTEEIIDRLFPGNPLLCVGDPCTKQDGSLAYKFDTKPRNDWRGHLGGHSLIVPSPMSAITGLAKNGRISKHTLANTGPRHFLIVECDFSEFDRGGQSETIYAPLIRKLAQTGFSVADMCAAVLLHLATYAPMVCAVHSAGKSVHGWFFVHGQPEEKAHKFFRYAVSLGSDARLWTRSQFVRMPDGTRDNGKRQIVYFLNFKPLEAP
jgi:hypothetical protein